MLKKIFRSFMIINFIWFMCAGMVRSAENLKTGTSGKRPENDEPLSLVTGFDFVQEYGAEVKSAIPALIEGLSSKQVDIIKRQHSSNNHSLKIITTIMHHKLIIMDKIINRHKMFL
jgi:hypothetical protein